MKLKRCLLIVPVMMAVTPAFAHTGVHLLSGFSDGFMHPLSGIDHALAMVTVGLFGVLLGGRALWAVPASFLVMMLTGGALGLGGIEIPSVEVGILASVVILGAVVALGWSCRTIVAMALVGAFAIFHGYAHGAEMPVGSAATAYSFGFVLASAALHGTGLVFGLIALGRRQVVRLAGASVAVAGLILSF